jgi:hypothetical protein
MAFGFFELDPRPRFTGPRLAAGAFAGMVGGLAFGILMTLQIMRGPYAPDGMAGMIARLLGTDNELLVWGAHLAAAAVFGTIFAAFVAPYRARRAIPLALAYGVFLWLFAAFLGLRLLTGTPVALSPSALYDLAGHLVFGLTLGAVYVAFFRQEDELAHERHLATPKPRAPDGRA